LKNNEKVFKKIRSIVNLEINGIKLKLKNHGKSQYQTGL